MRLFKDEDIDFAHELTIIEGWNCPRNDVERMFKCSPSGCFVAKLENERAGHVFSVSYGKLGWIGFLIVKGEHRRKGAGILLMKKAIGHLQSLKVETMKLEAVSTVADLYRRLGFVDEYYSLRLSGVSDEVSSSATRNVRFLKEEEITDLADFDAEYFGANRINVLSMLFHDYPELCFVSYAKSEISGYVMCRKAGTGYRIGPWVCNPDDPEGARELFLKCMQKVGCDEKLYIGVPAVNEKAVEILQDLGFEEYSRSIRMRFGKRLETERIDGVFAIGGPEKG